MKQVLAHAAMTTPAKRPKSADAAKGNRTTGPRQGRPKVSPSDARVTLSTSISPASSAILASLSAGSARMRGRIIDRALAAYAAASASVT